MKIISDNLTGKCDSLSFNQNDSLIKLYGSPIIWIDGYQVTSDTIILTYLIMKLKIFIYQIIPSFALNQILTFLIKLKAMKYQAPFLRTFYKKLVYTVKVKVFI